jgi:hypothetical protein
VITCVVPRELAGELYEKLVERYRDNPDVEVLVDRRSGCDRRRQAGFGGQRVTRDRRRARVPGTFLGAKAPPSV